MESHLNIVESANFMTYNGNHLFHYTSFSSALKIIVSGKLLFGEFKNMNDISESHREVMDPTLERPLHDYKSISLTYDDSSKRAKLFDRNIGVLFYDVTTLYFEADYEDDLSKTGFSKEGRHSNPQIILGLLVSLGGYPLAYCIHEGNKYEGHTMQPTINEFVSKYGLENFVVVTDSGLMNNANIAELETHGYKYIIGAKIKNESQELDIGTAQARLLDG